MLLHVLTTAVLALGLSGLSVGLGACLPNFRETDPSRIVSGFGGTMNLLVSLVFLLVVLALMAGPWHLQAAAAGEGEGRRRGRAAGRGGGAGGRGGGGVRAVADGNPGSARDGVLAPEIA